MNRPRLKRTIGFDWKAATTIGLAFCILMTLGFWQLDRAKEKRLKQQSIEARLTAKPISIDAIIANPLADMNFLRVSMRGHYLAEKPILWVDRFFAGQSGYEVLTPFKLASGHGIVFVNRGWIAPAADPAKLPAWDTPNTQVEISAVIQVLPHASFFGDQKLGGDRWPLRLRQLNVDRIAALFAEPVFPYVLSLDEGMPGILIHSMPAPDLAPERSSSYAIQWFAMAALLLLVTLFRCTNIADVLRSKS